MRQLPQLMSDVGFLSPQTKAHGFVQTTSADYMVSLLTRGVQAGWKAGEYGEDLANAFAVEAKRRVVSGTFYGAILFVSAIAQKPAHPPLSDVE
ncbi:MAG: hypothetical protein AAF399_15960 [Bacteroidota bacterium]